MTQPELDKWGIHTEKSIDEAFRTKFFRIQQSCATIIYHDVLKSEVFHGGDPHRKEIAYRLDPQGENRGFTMIGGLLPLWRNRSSKE
jgi:hypothetical protein